MNEKTTLTGMVEKAMNQAMGTEPMIGLDPVVGVGESVPTMSDGVADNVLILKIVLLYFVAPAIISLLIDRLVRRMGWVKPGDMKL